MTLNATRYFSNSIVGQPQVGADINILETNALPKYNVGFGFTRADGNKYRYGYANAGVAAGLLVAPTFASSGVATFDNVVVLPASAVAVAGEVILPGRIGSRYLEVTKASVTAGQYKGGYLVIEDGSGKGYTYRIKSNTATGNPATLTIRIELYEKLKANLSDDTDMTITPSLWNDVVIADSTNVMVAGVSCSTTTSTLPYGWFCTKGQCACKQTGTVVLGQGVQLSIQGGGGCVSTWGMAYTTLASLLGVAQVGICMAVGANGEYATINIDLE